MGVIKPYYEANPNDIQWGIQGATTTTINGTNLEIKGLNATVVFEQPYAYQVTTSLTCVPIASASWTAVGSNTFAISTGTYNPALPLIIVAKYGTPPTPSVTSQQNLEHCTFYGGALDDGFRIIKVNQSGQNRSFYTTIGSTRSYDINHEFPTVPGSFVTSSVSSTYGGNYLTTVLFDTVGVRKSANIYGIPQQYMNPVDAIINGDRITVIGNCVSSSTAFPGIVPTNYAANTYTTNTAGPGWLLQFQYDGNISMNKVKWFTRTNGYANSISFKPNTKEIYLTTTSDLSYTYDWMNGGAGSYFAAGLSGGWHFELSKYDSVGVRKYNQALPIRSTSVTPSYGNLDYFETPSANTYGDNLIKCKIECDKYGCTIAGEFNNNINTNTKYGAAGITNTVVFSSGSNDAFAMRFNAKDTMVFCRTVGGSSYDAFTNLRHTGSNQIALIGYSASTQTANLVYLAPSSTEYYDGVAASSSAKVLINKLDTIGNKLWGTLFGNGNFKNVPWGITDDGRNMYISGISKAGMSFPISNPGSVYNKTSAMGQTDAFLIAFDFTNNLLWNTYFGGTYSDCKLSLDWNNYKARLMFAGITNTEAKNPSPIANFFPATQASSSTYPGAWYVDNINASYSVGTIYYGENDAYTGWFLTNNVVYIGIKEYFKDQNDNSLFNLFPNPTNSAAYIAFKNAVEGQVTIDVYNQIGQLMYSETKNDLTLHSVVPINTSHLSDGIYFVNVKNKGVLTTKKLIVTR